ncbi:MAG: acyltransferase [Desulfatibacillaceae bacterium]
MFQFLPGTLRGCILVSLYFLNTVFWFSLIVPGGLLKLVVPVTRWRDMWSRVLKWMAARWVGINSFNTRMINQTQWDVQGLDQLDNKHWYLVMSNHQSWTDILVLQTVFHKRIPFLKFFLKKELIWVPFLGICWWALDFPFMKRYSKALLKAKPHLAGKDLETTKAACEKFRQNPVSIMNFVEGTRFTREKHARQESPHANLLRPRAGGVAFVLSAMGEQLDSIVNVTIAYPNGRKSFWDFMCGRVGLVRVHVETIPVTEEVVGDYFTNEEFRENFQEWLNRLWDDKQERMHGMLHRFWGESDSFTLPGRAPLPLPNLPDPEAIVGIESRRKVSQQ